MKNVAIIAILSILDDKKLKCESGICKNESLNNPRMTSIILLPKFDKNIIINNEKITIAPISILYYKQIKYNIFAILL